MDTRKLIEHVDALERQITKSKSTDVKTKYQTISLFKGIKKELNFRIPVSPINIENDGRYFECPTCGTRFETELDYVADDFQVCPKCGQLFKEVTNE